MSTPAPTLPEQNSTGTSPIDQTAVIAAQVSAAVTPVAVKAATDLIEQGHTALTKTIESGDTYLQGLVQDVDKRATEGIAANSQAIQDALGTIGATLETKLKTDPKIQSALILGTVGALLVGALSILIAALAGSHQANEWIGYAVGMFGTSIGGIVLHELGLLGTTQAPTPASTTLLGPAQFVGPTDTTALKLSGQIPMSVPGPVGTTIVTSTGT